MGGIFGGKSKSKSESGNLAYPAISQATQGSLGNIQKSSDLMNAFLNGDTSGFETYQKNSGFFSKLSEALKRQSAGGAAGGFLNSGATGRNLVRVGNEQTQQSASDYWQKLTGLGSQGSAAGALATSAGQYNKSNSQDGGKSGLGNALSLGANMIALSDPKLKTNVVRIGETPEGIPTYEYEYLWSKDKHIGVMADEVAEIKPEALGPTVAGYMSVDYSKLEV